VQRGDARGLQEQFARKMRDVAGAGGAVRQLARIGFAESEELADGLVRAVSVDDNRQGRRRHQRDGGKVANRIVVHLVQRVALNETAGIENDRIAVGLRLGDVVVRDRAVGAGLVIDEDRRAHLLRELLSEPAARQLDSAAGREADHHANGLVRVSLLRAKRLGCDHERSNDAGDRRFSACHFSLLVVVSSGHQL